MNFVPSSNDKLKNFTYTEKKLGEVTYYSFNIEFEEVITPSPMVIEFRFPLRDVNGIWVPCGSAITEVEPVWAIRWSSSQIASGAPVLSAFSGNGRNKFTLALSDVMSNTSMGATVIEEECVGDVKIKLFGSPVKPISSYSFILRMDERSVSFARAVCDVKTWWENDLGLAPCPVPEAAKHPVYSTWYNFHQRISPEAMLEELKIAKSLGFDTVIVDDGWQCLDNNRGYAFAGDWKPQKEKIGNGRDFCDACHALGIKVIFWYSVPFIGECTENHKRFEGKYLYHPGMGCSVLDPRFADVRRFLVELYKDAVRTYGLDGLKLDFIDMFKLREESPANYEDMDIPVLEDAVFALMSEVHKTLYEINPELMFEFRQTYIGPAICAFGNMLRVADCPYSGRTNCRASADLRLTSGKTAVHTDMTMWEKGTSTNDAARQLYFGLFAVPQISVLLKTLPEEHYRVVRRFLAYWNENREVLLDGEFDCSAPLGSYSYLSSFLAGKEIRLLITEKSAVLKHDRMDIVNVTGSDSVYLDLTEKSGDFHVKVTDCLGNVVLESVLPGGSVQRLALPDSAVAEIERV